MKGTCVLAALNAQTQNINNKVFKDVD